MQQDQTSRQRNYYAPRQAPTLQKVNLPSYANHKQFTSTKKAPYHPPQQQIDNSDKVDQIVGRISMKSSKQSKMDINKATKIVANFMLTYNCRRKYLKMRKQHRYRVCVIKELIETEIRYVDDLLKSMTLCNYIQQWVPKPQCEEIFINTKQIYQLNNKLLDDLKKKTEYKPYDQIGKLLCEYAPFFKIYFEYYSKFKKSETTLALCLQKYPEFNKYYKSMVSSKEFKFQQIDSYLVKPIQRLPKYNLLLIDLIKHTDNTHPDFKNLNQCQVLFSKVAEENNEHLNLILMNSKLFELQRIFGQEVQVLDSNRTYLTEQNMTVLHKNKEKTVLLFLLSDLIILADTQPLQDKPYKLVFSLHLDHNSQCIDMEDLESFKNMFTLKGTTQSITFIEQAQELKVYRMQQFQKIIDALANSRKMREDALVKSKIKVDKVHQIQVQVIGVDERKTNMIKSHKVYIVEVQIGEVCQRIFPRFSHCVQIQDEIKKKYPKCQLNYMKQHSSFSLQSEEKEVEGRIIQVTNFITSLLAQPFMREDPKFLQALGLPENFYDLPNLITDELRDKPRNRSSRGPDRMEYMSPQRQLIRKNGSVSNMGSMQEGSGLGGKKFSATQLLKEVKKPVQKQTSKEMMQILVYHFDPKHKPQMITITFESKAIEVCEVLKDRFQLLELFDFKLFMMDSKQRLKAMEDDERISDLFSGSFILDFQKKKEFYFRKYLFLDLMSEKQQLYQDHKKLELVYNQLLSEIVSAQLQFNFEDYCLLGSVYLYINGMYAQMETLGKVIPNMVLKQEKKELWITKVNQSLIKLIGQITNNSSIHEDKEDKEDLRQQMGSQVSTTISLSSGSQSQFDPDVNLGMMTFVQLCYQNQFCGKQLFPVNCKDLQKEFGENNFYLVVGYDGTKLFNSKKNRLLIEFNEVTQFKVFPGSIQFNTIEKNYKFETGQGFQIQSIIEEYLQLKDQ